MAKDLTKRQQTVLQVIRAWMQDQGCPPTIRELGKQLNIKSLRGVTTHLDAIAKKGFLTRKPGARGIRLKDLVSPIANALRIPVVGRVRAGEPILAQENIEEHVTVDSRWIGGRSETSSHFALKVQGESMIGAGILDGDYVIVRQQPTASNGDIVVALLEDEATVKRFYREGEQIRLQPENPKMKPIIVSKQESVSILGKVTAVFRKLG